MNKHRYRIFLITIVLLLSVNLTAQAQTEPEYPYYVIQSGDTLNVVALRFGVSVNDLISLNEITDPNAISIGDSLKIPGFEGIQGELVLKTVQFGESYQALTLQNRFPADLISRLNRLISRDEIYVGSRLIIPVSEDSNPLKILAIVADHESMLDVAVQRDLNPWTIALQNSAALPSRSLPGDLIYGTMSESESQPLASIAGVETLEITPLPFVQGKTIEIKVKTSEPMQLMGQIGEKTVMFFQTAENEYVGLHGLSAEEETGILPIRLEGGWNGQPIFQLDQRILVESGYYGEGPSIYVDPVTIDPAVTEPEQDLVEGLTGIVNPERYWEGKFQYPVDEPCLSAGFGASRVYNGSYHYYHTGLDFAVCTASNANVYAAAPGRVVFAGPLVVRGNAVIIDHGWGVYTGYWHQTSLAVSEGDLVEAGQLLGIIGTTGRSTGYHLHFEVWVNGTQVDPYEWLEQEYP